MNSEVLQVGLVAAFAAAHSGITRGLRRAALFAVLGLGAAFAGEYVGVNVTRVVRHHTRPQAFHVPLVALASWYAIAYGAFDAAQAIVGARRWLTPVLAAVIATSLDLLLDVYGLAHGRWEWRTGGRYAREVVGRNGQRGVPLLNYAGWLLLIGGIGAAYALGDEPGQRNTARGAAGLVLLAYFAPAAAWAARTGHGRYVAFAAAVPVAVLLGLVRSARRT